MVTWCCRMVQDGADRYSMVQGSTRLEAGIAWNRVSNRVALTLSTFEFRTAHLHDSLNGSENSKYEISGRSDSI